MLAFFRAFRAVHQRKAGRTHHKHPDRIAKRCWNYLVGNVRVRVAEALRASEPNRLVRLNALLSSRFSVASFLSFFAVQCHDDAALDLHHDTLSVVLFVEFTFRNVGLLLLRWWLYLLLLCCRSCRLLWCIEYLLSCWYDVVHLLSGVWINPNHILLRLLFHLIFINEDF